MDTWDISKKFKSKIISGAQNIDNNETRILYLLRNLGPQRFTEIVEYSGLSRSTTSKYLKYHIEQNNIEKNIYTDKNENISEQRYFITELGIENLSEESLSSKEILYFNEINKQISDLSNLINYYEKIGIEESIIFNIIRIISKIGEEFFFIEQSQDLYLTLFYIFLNSVLTRDYKFEIDGFCEQYNVKKIKIEYFVDKIMSSKLGFFMFARGDDMFFFHEDDVIGTTALRLIKDYLIDEIIHINRKGYRKVYDLDKISEEIADKLMMMGLIWDRIREPFEMLLEKLLIRAAKEMGISKIFLKDLVIQSEKMPKSKEGISSLLNIIEGSESYEDLNLVSIPDAKEININDVLGPLQGFCPNCGKIILEQDLSNKCAKCEIEFKPEDLLKSVDLAKKASKRFKHETLQRQKLLKCPNPKCSFEILSSWEFCPYCNIKIKKNKK